MLIDDHLYRRLDDLLDWLVEQGRAEITAQGHVATGRGRASLEGKIVSRNAERIEAVVLAADYMVGPVDEGVPASRVPYGGRSGRGGTSKYIAGLMDWLRVVKPSLRDQERKSMAFAIATVAKREGHPTRGSYSFSRNGRRTSWIEKGLAVNEQTLVDRLRLFALMRKSITENIEKAAA